jgi:hypothetical protein
MGLFKGRKARRERDEFIGDLLDPHSARAEGRQAEGIAKSLERDGVEVDPEEIQRELHLIHQQWEKEDRKRQGR